MRAFRRLRLIMQCPKCGEEASGDQCPACKTYLTEETPKWYAEGVAHLASEKQFTIASELLQEGLQRYPASAMLWYNGGVLAEMLKNAKDAATYYQKAINCKPIEKYYAALERVLGRKVPRVAAAVRPTAAPAPPALKIAPTPPAAPGARNTDAAFAELEAQFSELTRELYGTAPKAPPTPPSPPTEPVQPGSTFVATPVDDGIDDEPVMLRLNLPAEEEAAQVYTLNLGADALEEPDVPPASVFSMDAWVTGRVDDLATAPVVEKAPESLTIFPPDAAAPDENAWLWTLGGETATTQDEPAQPAATQVTPAEQVAAQTEPAQSAAMQTEPAEPAAVAAVPPLEEAETVNVDWLSVLDAAAPVSEEPAAADLAPPVEPEEPLTISPLVIEPEERISLHPAKDDAVVETETLSDLPALEVAPEVEIPEPPELLFPPILIEDAVPEPAVSQPEVIAAASVLPIIPEETEETLPAPVMAPIEENEMPVAPAPVLTPAEPDYLDLRPVILEEKPLVEPLPVSTAKPAPTPVKTRQPAAARPPALPAGVNWALVAKVCKYLSIVVSIIIVYAILIKPNGPLLIACLLIVIPLAVLAFVGGALSPPDTSRRRR